MNMVYVPADLLRQRQWMIAAVAYYRAKVLLYELIIQEWQEELDALRATKEHSPNETIPH